MPYPRTSENSAIIDSVICVFFRHKIKYKHHTDLTQIRHTEMPSYLLTHGAKLYFFIACEIVAYSYGK